MQLNHSVCRAFDLAKLRVDLDWPLFLVILKIFPRWSMKWKWWKQIPFGMLLSYQKQHVNKSTYLAWLCVTKILLTFESTKVQTPESIWAYITMGFWEIAYMGTQSSEIKLWNVFMNVLPKPNHPTCVIISLRVYEHGKNFYWIEIQLDNKERSNQHRYLL